MLLLSKEDIMKVFTMKNSIEAVENAFKSFSEGKTDVPLRTQIQAPAHDGVFVFMPAYCAQIDAASLKVVDVFPHNIDNGIPSIPAQVILIDGKTGVASALLDGTYVTQMRTGAASGAAFDLLAKRDCVKGALIGTGGQAPAQLEAMLTARKLKEVRVFDINLERCRAFVAQMNEELKSYGTKIIPASSSDEAIAKADLIITVTLSDTPVFDGTKIKAGATVSCVGSYQPHMQELDPALLPRAARVYCDSLDAVLAESGDIIKPLAEGIITKEKLVGDLGDVILGKLPGRLNDEEILVFKSVGIGVQDLFTAKAIYDQAVAAGVGLKWC